MSRLTVHGGSMRPLPPHETIVVTRRVWVEVLAHEVRVDALARGIPVPPLSDKRQVLAAFNRAEHSRRRRRST